jgi:hypothetical protein
MPSRLELLCVSIIVGVRNYIQIILLIIFSLLLLPICRLMAHMVLILVNTPRVFLKYSEQLDKCQLIQHNANITCTKCNGGPGII